MSRSQEQHKKGRNLGSLRTLPWRKVMCRTRFGGFALITAVLFLAGCDVAPQPPAHDHSWLSYKYSRNCSGCSDLTDTAEGANYYTAIGIDLTQQPPFDFSAWLTANGFTSGAQEIRAVYGNRGDLAFGRDMHCLQSAQQVACYVTNYGPTPADQTGDLNCDWTGCDGNGHALFQFPKLENGS